MGQNFYAYMWLRQKDGSYLAGTPYYVGKGYGDRAFISDGHVVHRPKDKSLILIFPRDSEQEAFATEIELIANWGRIDNGTGCLRNRTDGGEGQSGICRSEETKAKMSAAQKGRKQSPGHWLGLKHTSEAKAKMRAAKLGSEHSPEHKAKIGAASKGNKYFLGHKHSPETKAKMSTAAKVRACAPEARAKMSAIAKARWAAKSDL
jgi:NUMOD3 motif